MPLLLLRTGILLALLLPGFLGRAQAPDWQSAVSIGSVAVEAMQADNSGNLYVAGEFASSVTLGSTTLTSAGGIDVFVAKWSTVTNTFIWARQAGGPGDDYVRALATKDLNLYLAGDFGESAAQFGRFTLANAGKTDAFVAKLADAGTSADFAWAQALGGANEDSGQSLAVLGSAVYLGGYYTGPVQLGPTSLIGPGKQEAFVARLNDAGSSASISWALSPAYNTANNDAITTMAVTNAGLYVGGYTNNYGEYFSSGLLRHYTTFVTKVVDAGNSASPGWKLDIPQQRDIGAYLIQLAASENIIYLSGRFEGSMTWGTTTLTGPAYAPFGDDDMYLTKLVDMGATYSLGWAKQSKSRYAHLFTSSLAVQGSEVYIAGSVISNGAYGNTTELDSLIVTNKRVDNQPLTSTLFVTKLLDRGSTASFKWVQQATGDVRVKAFALQGNRLHVTGQLNYDTSSRNTSFGTVQLVGGAFLASLAAQPLPTRDPALQAALGLYPNPAHGAATVRVPAGTGRAALTLLDALGRVVRAASAPAGADYSLGLAGLAPGLYTLRVRVGDALATQKLAVE